MKVSEDLTVLNLVAPATERDFEMAAREHLASLVSLTLGPKEKAILAALTDEWGMTAREVKLKLMETGLRQIRSGMFEDQPAQLPTKKWVKDSEGRKKSIVPAEKWGHMRKPDGTDAFDLTRWPMAEDVDRFGWWLRTKILRSARDLLSEREDVLDDPYRWEAYPEESGDLLDRSVPLMRSDDHGDVIEWVPASMQEEAEADLVLRRIELLAAYEEALSDLLDRVLFNDQRRALKGLLESVRTGKASGVGEKGELKLKMLAKSRPELGPLVMRAKNLASALRMIG